MNNILASKIHVLEVIEDLQLSTDNPLYINYPAMKLGDAKQIYFFADLMYERVKAIVFSDYNKLTSCQWVLSAPAYFELPSAANLIARYIYRRLCDENIEIQIIEPRLSEEQISVNTEEEFSDYHNYCSGSREQRIAQRSRMNILSNTCFPVEFNGASVIVINDVYVTGTQQLFMNEKFQSVNTKEVYWFYVFKLTHVLAQSSPEIEYQLNNSSLTEDADFVALLNDKNTEYTACCISRLFYYDYEDFCRLIKLLNLRTKNLIFSLCLIEKRYDRPLFKAKMAFLESQQSVDLSLQFYV